MGKDQASPTPANSLNPSDPSDGRKTSFPTRGTIQDFYQLICPWYQSQFEHYSAYNLGIKLWLQKGKVTFWHRMAMMFFRLWRKLVKLKIFFLETAKSVLFAYAIKNNKFVKKRLPREKLEVNPWKCPWNTQPTLPETSALGKLELQKKGGWGEAKRHFKCLVENYEISVCLSQFMYVSVCVFCLFVYFHNIAKMVNEF